MRNNKINLDYKKLLGFRLITPPEDGDVKSASHFSKIGGKSLISENVRARIGSKAGSKVGTKSMINARIGVKAGAKT